MARLHAKRQAVAGVRKCAEAGEYGRGLFPGAVSARTLGRCATLPIGTGRRCAASCPDQGAPRPRDGRPQGGKVAKSLAPTLGRIGEDAYGRVLDGFAIQACIALRSLISPDETPDGDGAIENNCGEFPASRNSGKRQSLPKGKYLEHISVFTVPRGGSGGSQARLKKELRPVSNPMPR
jgi:hypothetical protein